MVVSHMKYCKMENFRNEDIMNYLADNEEPYVALEKIHGSNISGNFKCENGKIEEFMIGKRNGPVGEKEKFYDCHNTFGKIMENLTNCVMALISKEGETVVRFFGEIYGGSVQKMDYNENISIAIFDIVVNDI